MIKRHISQIYTFLFAWAIVLVVTCLYFEYYPQYQTRPLIASTNIALQQDTLPFGFKQSYAPPSRGYRWSIIKQEDVTNQHEQVLSLTPIPKKNAQFIWYIVIPIDCKYLMVNALLKSHEINSGNKKWKGGRLDLQYLDTKGKVRWDLDREIVQLLGSNDWKVYQRVFSVPKNTSYARLIISHSGTGGVVFGKDIKVTDVISNPKFIVGKRIAGGVFLLILVTGLFLFTRNKHVSFCVLFVTVTIGTGTILPDYLLADIVQHTLEYTKKVYRQTTPQMVASLPGQGKVEPDPMVSQEKESREQAILLIKTSGHFGLYMILGFLVFRQARQKKCCFANMVLYGIVLILFATTTEVSQFFTETRSPHLSDLRKRDLNPTGQVRQNKHFR